MTVECAFAAVIDVCCMGGLVHHVLLRRTHRNIALQLMRNSPDCDHSSNSIRCMRSCVCVPRAGLADDGQLQALWEARAGASLC